MSDSLNIEHIRHSLAHLLAAAVLELYPDAKLTLGPAIETGFYYDIDTEATRNKNTERDGTFPLRFRVGGVPRQFSVLAFHARCSIHQTRSQMSLP